MHVQIVGEDMRVNGVNMRIYAFQSEDSVADIAAYFEGLWNGRMARSEASPWTILARRERDELITVQMQADPQGRTHGFIALGEIFDLLGKRPRRQSPALPMLPGSEVLHDIEAEDAGRPSRTLVVSSDRSAGENLEFYRAYFLGEGYEPISHGAVAKAHDGGAMILNRGAEQVNLAIVERHGQTLITVVKVRQ